MARKTIRDKLRALKRKFPFRTSYGFLHLKKLELRRKYTSILLYCLIYSPEKGYSLLVWDAHRRGHNKDAKEWNQWINTDGIEALKDYVLPAISAKRGDSWEFHRLIGFSGAKYVPTIHVLADRDKDAIYPNQNKSKRSRRNKTNDKGK
jgi:hypothetical protein